VLSVIFQPCIWKIKQA